MIANANEVDVRINGELIAFSQEVSLSFTNSLMEVTTSPSSGYKQMISGKKSAVISFSGLIDYSENVNTIGDNLRSGSQVTFRFGAGGGKEFDGDGYVSSFEQSGGTNDAPTYSGSIELTDELARSIQTQLENLCINGEEIRINGETLCVRVQI